MLTHAALAGLAVTAPPALAAPFAFTRTLALAAPAAGDLFGAAVVVRDGLVAASAPYRDVAGVADAGAVVVLDADSGAQVATLTATSPASGERLGSALALAGTDLVVGVPHEDAGAPHAGAVRRFALATGTPGAVVPNPVAGFDDVFGSAVAAVGGDVVVGAPLDGAAVENAGAAWVLRADGGVRAQLSRPDPVAYSLFGSAVASDGAYVVVGAPSDDLVAANGGAAYVFDAASGAFLHTLAPEAPARGDDFGRALAARGGIALVGAPLDEVEGAAAAGSVSVFDLASGELVRRCPSPEPEAGARFGAAVAFRGTDLVVGAPFTDRDGVVDAGAVWILDATCTPLARLDPPSPHTGAQLGNAVASDGAALVVAGAWRDGAVRPDAGAVHCFVDLGGTTTTVPATSTTTISSTSTTTRPGATTTTVDTSSLPTTSSTTTTAPAGSTSTTEVPATPTTLPPGGVPTTLPAPGTTSTTIAPGTTPGAGCEPAGCDDADACTSDACDDDGTCTHEPLPAWDGVGCVLERLGATLDARGVDALGPRLARRAARQLHAVRGEVGRARPRSGARMRRPLRRAVRGLAAFATTVQRATPRGALRGPAEAALLEDATAARAAIAALVR